MVAAMIMMIVVVRWRYDVGSDLLLSAVIIRRQYKETDRKQKQKLDEFEKKGR
jgi:hypothetical protein